ncbi:MAG: peptidoglycan-binding protein [Thermoleophilia bacterium]|nr:peptidoglycan-binding protein [Thermoleophilia bacterium]
MSTGGDDRDDFAEDWFEEPGREPSGAFRDPEAETWLEEEPEYDGGPTDRRPLIAAGAVVVALILAGIGIARVVGGDDEEPAGTPTATTGATATAPTGTGETQTTETAQPPITVPTDATLTSGDEGQSVTLLQQGLAQLGYDVGTPDGVYGPGTAEAVRQFQADSGLDADGVAGPATLAALNQALTAGG